MKYSSEKLPTVQPTTDELEFDKNIHEKAPELEGNIFDAIKSGFQIYHRTATRTFIQDRELNNKISRFENDENNPEFMRAKVITPIEAADRGVPGLKENISEYALQEYTKLNKQREQWDLESGKYLQTEKWWLAPFSFLGSMAGTLLDPVETGADALLGGVAVKGVRMARKSYRLAKKVKQVKALRKAGKKADKSAQAAQAAKRNALAAKLDNIANTLKPKKTKADFDDLGQLTRTDLAAAHLGSTAAVNTLAESYIHYMSKERGYEYDLGPAVAMGIVLPATFKVLASGITGAYRVARGKKFLSEMKTEMTSKDIADAKKRVGELSKELEGVDFDKLDVDSPEAQSLLTRQAELQTHISNIFSNIESPTQVIKLGKIMGLPEEGLKQYEGLAVIEDKLGIEFVEMIIKEAAEMTKDGVGFDFFDRYPMLRDGAEFARTFDKYVKDNYGVEPLQYRSLEDKMRIFNALTALSDQDMYAYAKKHKPAPRENNPPQSRANVDKTPDDMLEEAVSEVSKGVSQDLHKFGEDLARQGKGLEEKFGKRQKDLEDQIRAEEVRIVKEARAKAEADPAVQKRVDDGALESAEKSVARQKERLKRAEARGEADEIAIAKKALKEAEDNLEYRKGRTEIAIAPKKTEEGQILGGIDRELDKKIADAERRLEELDPSDEAYEHQKSFLPELIADLHARRAEQGELPPDRAIGAEEVEFKEVPTKKVDKDLFKEYDEVEAKIKSLNKERKNNINKRKELFKNLGKTKPGSERREGSKELRRLGNKGIEIASDLEGLERERSRIAEEIAPDSDKLRELKGKHEKLAKEMDDEFVSKRPEEGGFIAKDMKYRSKIKRVTKSKKALADCLRGAVTETAKKGGS